MKQKGTYLVPQLYVIEVIDPSTLPPNIRAKLEVLRPLIGESFRLALRAKVKIAFGTDAAVYPHGDNAKEFDAQVFKDRPPEPVQVGCRAFHQCIKRLQAMLVHEALEPALPNILFAGSPDNRLVEGEVIL